jgi:23S rRNA (cytosine1962-C5)-methyltransferase
MASPIVVRLKPAREKSVRKGHPWVFSGAVAAEEGDTEAAVAEVVGAKGEKLGCGFYSPKSQIRARLLAAPETSIDQAFFRHRLEQAQALRQGLLGPETTGYRLVNAEGDGLPGWTVDVFGNALVSQITVAGLEKLRAPAYEALQGLFPEAVILQPNDAAHRRQEGLSTTSEVIAGEAVAEVEFLENGLRFVAELAGGQKTGFYCDQRENRQRVESLAAGKRVLDLFAHAGAFGLYALRGGALSVRHVESAPRLVALGQRQGELNRAAGIDPEASDWLQGDVFDVLRSHRETYDLVICDPPPLARRRSAVQAAARAYKDLNRLALKRVEAGGLFLTFSCSGAVDTKLFRQILFAAADEARVELSLLAPLAAAADHPVSVYHPEGEYLKGWLCAVRGRRSFG